VLAHAWRSALMPEVVSSLPIFGVDGTFKSRTAGTAIGEAHLKGGTLNGVQAIAGYVLDRKGRRWIVAMLVNHEKAAAAQPAMDALVEWVHAR
jgi:serine-type D-Ala-D-Ala carboxypeptidase/endopeptidase (penicillin-binding protein 4)